jgi:hypothetical protein
MAHVRTNLIRLGTLALASSAALAVGANVGLAAAASSSGSSNSGTSGRNTVPATLTGIKALANTEITKRVNSLHAAVGKANRATGLGSGQSALVSYLGADVAPLQQLNQKIQGDTTVTQARQDFSTIFTGFRVYLLVLPASHLAAVADRDTTTVIPRLSSDATKAQGYVNSGNQTQLQPLITDLTNQSTSAANAANGLSASLLAYTPAQFNANHSLLTPAKSSEQTARSALGKGHTDVTQIRRALKSEGTTGSALRNAGLKGSGQHHRHNAKGSGGKGRVTTTTAPPTTSQG